MPKKWKVEFILTVADEWIDDGFILKEEHVIEGIQSRILWHAYDEEKAITDISVRDITNSKTQSKHCDTVCSVNARNCYSCGGVLI